jgi:hypothetical protein
VEGLPGGSDGFVAPIDYGVAAEPAVVQSVIDGIASSKSRLADALGADLKGRLNAIDADRRYSPWAGLA